MESIEIVFQLDVNKRGRIKATGRPIALPAHFPASRLALYRVVIFYCALNVLLLHHATGKASTIHLKLNR